MRYRLGKKFKDVELNYYHVNNSSSIEELSVSSPELSVSSPEYGDVMNRFKRFIEIDWTDLVTK